MQVPVQTLSQQTPCWQVPLPHSLLVVQIAPITFLPQIVPLQTLPDEQSALVLQLTRQVPAVPHMYSLHETGLAAAQVPAPSQRAAPAPIEPPTAQVGSWQIVAFEYISQPPLPSQSPSVPQVARPLSVHWPGRAVPAGTAVQRPALCGTAHDMQVPEQAVWQQIPCWHRFELQSSLVVHEALTGFLPQLPLLQTLPPSQSALVVHVRKQALPALLSQT